MPNRIEGPYDDMYALRLAAGPALANILQDLKQTYPSELNASTVLTPENVRSFMLDFNDSSQRARLPEWLSYLLDDESNHPKSHAAEHKTFPRVVAAVKKLYPTGKLGVRFQKHKGSPNLNVSFVITTGGFDFEDSVNLPSVYHTAHEIKDLRLERGEMKDLLRKKYLDGDLNFAQLLAVGLLLGIPRLDFIEKDPNTSSFVFGDFIAEADKAFKNKLLSELASPIFSNPLKSAAVMHEINTLVGRVYDAVLISKNGSDKLNLDFNLYRNTLDYASSLLTNPYLKSCASAMVDDFKIGIWRAKPIVVIYTASALIHNRLLANSVPAGFAVALATDYNNILLPSVVTGYFFYENSL